MSEVNNIITVTVLNRYVKTLLERDPVLTDVRLRGEISNFVHHRSGHWYFSLKDKDCSVKAVMFRGDAQQLNFEPQNGMQVVVSCRISLFERDGSFQVYVESMFPDGLGSIRQAFEQLKARLEKEGLFEPEHKKPLPQFPSVVGLITSGTGAALQDIRNVLSRRFPLVRAVLCPVNVQGNEAAGEIAQAIQNLDETGLADVIIVARGGGSAEDLWVFNDERIARAAYHCKTPLISAIGHEIDFTMLDFAADLRAPTPSAAAELAVPDWQALSAQKDYYCVKIQQVLENKLQLCYNKYEKLLDAVSDYTAQRVCSVRQQALEQLRNELERGIRLKTENESKRLVHCLQLADSLNPYTVLARGYAMITKEDKAVSPETIVEGDDVTIETRSARLQCRVNAVERKEP